MRYAQELHSKKSHDYGDREGDPLDNLHASRELGVPDWVGVLIRANDKWRRIKNYAKHRSLVNEDVTEDLVDMANYLILARVLLEEERASLSKVGYEKEASQFDTTQIKVQFR